MAGAALLGAFAPDASLYLMAGVSLFLLRVPPEVVFNELYFSPAWQTVFAIDNSLFVWAAFLAIVVWFRSIPGMAFACSGLLHIALDFPLHAGDGRPHFWPVSRWVFDSPISYWDSTHYAAFVAPVSVLLCLLAFVTLWRRGSGWAMRLGYSALMLAELWVLRQWLLFF